MAKYYGAVGYAENVEIRKGVFEEKITERKYHGNVERNTRRWENSGNLHDDLNVNNTISIIADAYANQHFFAIRYVRWMGGLWKVTNVEVRRPRLILTIGGVYNGPKA